MTYFFTVCTVLLSLIAASFGATGTGGSGGSGSASNAVNTVDTSQFVLTKAGNTWTIIVKNGATFTNLILRAASLPTGTASRAVILSSDGFLTNSATTDTEIGYVSGLSGPIQGLLAGKLTVDTGIDFPHTIASALTFNNDQTINGNLTISGGQTNGGPMKASTFYGDGSHLTGIAGGGSQTPLTADVNGAANGITNLSKISLGQSPSNQVDLIVRPSQTTFPVLLLRPMSNGVAGIFDLAPRGGVAAGASLPTRFDICNADPEATNNFGFGRIGVDTVSSYFDTQVSGTGTALELHLKVAGVDYQKVLTSGNMEFQNTVAGQSYWRFGNLSANAAAVSKIFVTDGLAVDLCLEHYNSSHASYPNFCYVHADGGAGLLLGADAATGVTRVLSAGVSISANTAILVTNSTVRIPAVNGMIAGTVVLTNAVWDSANNVFDSMSTGSPETVLTAGIGSIYRRRDGGAGTVLYVKESGTGNTGWIAK